MTREHFPYMTDVAVEFVSTEDLIAQNPLDNTNNGSTCSFKVYDPGKDQLTRFAQPTSETLIAVTDPSAFEVGDQVEITLANGNIHTSTVVGIDDDMEWIQIAGGLPSATDTDARVRVLLGTEVTMDEFGTARIGSKEYGFRGTLAASHPVHVLDQEFNIEIKFVGAPGGGLDALDLICGVIKPRGECR